jgi:mono/diheme cytochrome c family protein
MRTIAGGALLALIASGVMAEDTMVRDGRQLAETYCSVCHSLDPAGASPHPEAPPFRTLHERYDVDWLAEALVEGLVSGHPDMPEFEFDPLQAEAIIVYLKSLE